MLTFIIRRLLGAVLVLVVGCCFVFLVVFVLPGDPVSVIGGRRALPDATRVALRAKYRLDDPLWRQLAHYLASLARGDLGESLATRRPVRSMIAETLPATLRLAGLAVVLEAVLGTVAAIVGVLTKRRFVDALVTVSTTVLVAMPTFVLGSLAQYLFGVRWRLLPVAGLRDGWRSLVLPAASLATVSVAYVARLLRARLDDEMVQPYVVTARAKGLGRLGVLRHALRNSLPVVVTFLGFDVATLMGGAIVTEIIFNIDGVGLMVARAISQRDQVTIVGFSVVSMAGYVLAGIVVDMLVAVADPRVTVG